MAQKKATATRARPKPKAKTTIKRGGSRVVSGSFKGKLQQQKSFKLGLLFFALLAIIGFAIIRISADSTPYNLFGSLTPTNIDDNDATANQKGVELGVRFRADTNGFIKGVRFYKASTNTGAHTGTLWSTDGTKTKLRTVTFTNESASGWQQANFSEQYKVTAGATYLVSYHTNNGHYSGDTDFFRQPYVKSPLRAPADGDGGPNGLYIYGASAYPTQTYKATNYYVDPVFVKETSTPTTSLFDTKTPANQTATDKSPVELGMKFKTSATGSIAGVRFYKSTANTGQHFGTLWNSSGQRLATVSFTNETASGWQQALFSAPVPVTPNTTYVVSYFAPKGSYSYNFNYFTKEQKNGNLTGLANSTPGGNGVFAFSTGSVFPNKTYLAMNYWVDVMFSPTSTSPNPSPVPTPPAPAPSPPTPTPPAPTPTTPTPAPTPPPTPPSSGRCPAFPAFPSASCTGPTTNSLTTMGSFSTTSNGQVIDGKLITGDVELQHDNVTITNSRIKGRIWARGRTGLTLRNVDLGPDQCSNSAGDFNSIVQPNGYSLYNVRVHHNNADLLQVGGGNPIIIQDSMLTQTCYYPGAHLDALQFYDPGGKLKISLIHNVLDSRPVNTGGFGNGSIMWGDHPGAGTVFTAYNNSFAGGNYTTYLTDASVASGVLLDFHDNIYVSGSSQYGPCTAGGSSAYNGTYGLRFVNNKMSDGSTASC